jgi:hypothetical protein
MIDFRFKKLFPYDAINSSLTQEDLKKYARLAVIENVNTEEGTCAIRWWDRPGGRSDVIITQSNSNSYSFPKNGSVVICVFDKFDRAFITSYISVGNIEKIKNLNTLPKFKPGDQFFEAGDSYIYLQRNGNIILATAQGYVSLDSNTNTFEQEVTNWKLNTDGINQYNGVVKRFITSSINNRGINIIEKEDGDAFIEHIIKVHETNNESSDLLYELKIGTLIDSEGQILSKSGNILDNNSVKQICVDINFSNGMRIVIDKEGYLHIDNAKLFVNNPSVDNSQVDEDRELTNNTNLGNQGQRVSRVHDEVTIPIGNAYTSDDYKKLNIAAPANIDGLVNILVSLLTGVSGNPVINTAQIIANKGSVINSSLQGIITSGASNIQIGDS